MADFILSGIPDDKVNGVTTNLGPTGTVMHSKRMLGEEGAGSTGRGGWFRNNGLWKTFMLYNFDRVGAVDSGVDVRIEACMELASDPDDPDVDTFVIELAALSNASPSFSIEYPWRYVRARVHAFAGTKNVQVGAHMQGQG